MSHYAFCGENEREFIRKYVSKEPALDSCLCKAHQTEAKRMWTNPNFIPKWQSCGTACEDMKIYNSNGLLCHNSEDNKAAGFLRIIGCLYFKKHYSAVVSLKSIETPQQLLHSFPPDPEVDQHKAWYNAIRSIVSDRIMNEEERMPSLTALWLCSCWVAKMWYNSTEEDLYDELPPPELCGWCKDEGGDYTCDWEWPEVIKRITDTIDLITKGCSCKNGCQTNQCGCRKACGPGCHCQGCKNVAAVTEMPCEGRDILTDTESDSGSSCNESSDCLETEIVTDLARRSDA